MPLIDLQKAPSPSTIRWFGASLAGLFFLLAAILRSAGSVWIPIGLSALAIVELACYYALPTMRVPIIRAWQCLTFPIAYVIGHLLLALTYFLVFLPIGWVLRLTNHDPLQLRRFARARAQQSASASAGEEESFWEDHKGAKDRAQYFRQY